MVRLVDVQNFFFIFHFYVEFRHGWTSLGVSMETAAEFSEKKKNKKKEKKKEEP